MCDSEEAKMNTEDTNDTSSAEDCTPVAGYAANGQCAECGCKPPGHGILCKTGNDIARKSQAAFAAKWREAKRKHKRRTQ